MKPVKSIMVAAAVLLLAACVTSVPAVLLVAGAGLTAAGEKAVELKVKKGG